MILDNNNWHSPVRQIAATVELLEGSTNVATFTEQDRIKSFDIQRVASNGKFFGFGVCQRMNIHFVDVNRELYCMTNQAFKCYLASGGERINAFPAFHITENHRNENTNELSVTAYDKLYQASFHTYTELEMTAPYTILELAEKIASFLGMNEVIIKGLPEGYTPFETEYPTGANFEGIELLRSILDSIAEVTQTVYYVDANENLVFKMPDRDGEPVYIIDKSNYITLSSKTNRRLSDIASVTELGDNVITESGIIGTVVYIKDNPFWDLRDDVHILLDDALAAVLNLTINQFNCSWRGNPSLEFGDKIALVTKDNEVVYSFIYDDIIKYDGHLSQTTQWEYSENEVDGLHNPVSLGDALKKTYAKVDKANQQIEMVAGEMAAIRLNSEQITQTVQRVDAEMDEVIAQVESKLSADELEIAVQRVIEEGVERVTTTTGYSFNEEGLRITKSDSQMDTLITEDGVKIYRNGEEVLVADNLGVKAEDLHATTFLIIGDNSRLENYGSNRTGCYYIRKQGGTT